MLNDLIKILLEEPHKLKALFIKFVQFILSVILASHVYLWLFGSYKIINFISISEWTEFALSGRVLVVLFIFLLSDFALYSLLPTITTGLLLFLARKCAYKGDGMEERHFLRWVLKLFDIIEYDKESKQISAGRNAKQFEAAMEHMSADEGRDDLYDLKNSYLNGIVHTYLTFTLIFTLYIDRPEIHVIAKGVYAIAIVLPAFYLYLSLIVSYLDKNATELLKGIKQLRLAKSLKEIYDKYSIYQDSKPANPQALITIDGVPIFLFWRHTERLLETYDIEFKIEEAHKRKSMFKILTNADLAYQTKKMYEANFDVCEILHYKDEEGLMSIVRELAMKNDPIYVEIEMEK